MGHVTLERSPVYCDELAANLWDLTKDDLWTDFAISVGKRKLLCHRVVLAASSPMLRAAIAADMAERRTGEINLDHFSVAVMEVVLQYMYMGEVTIESRLLKDLLLAADYLQMRVLKQQCIDLIQGNVDITPENVIFWCPVALQFGLHDITEQCSHVAASSFSEIIQTDEFLALGTSDIRDYLDLMQEEVLEDSLLEAALAWTSYKIEERVDYLEDLLKTIKLEDCSQEALQLQTVLHAELLDVRPKLFKLLFMASITPHRSQNNTLPDKKCRTFRKKISERLVVIGGRNFNLSVNRDCWYLDLKTHRMTKFTEIPTDCYYDGRGSVCKTPDGFVLTGGKYSNICVKYITTTGSWVHLQRMPVKRFAHESIWVNGKLYVIGGCVCKTYQISGTSSVDYLSTDGKWHKGPALPGEISHPLVANVDNNVYVLDAYYSGQMYVGDLTYSRGWRDWFWSIWKQRASVPSVDLITGMTAMNARLYIYSKSNTFAYYYPSSDTWCKLRANSPTLSHCSMPLVHFGDKLYLMGESDEDPCNGMEEYDPETQKWTQTGFSPNEQLLCYHHAMALNMPS